MARTEAVFFDVDFTLIFPGPRFQASGYRSSCAQHGIETDATRFEAAVAGAASLLDSEDQLYDPQVFVNYTRRIVELMGGCGPAVDRVAREMFDEWAHHHHFSLYDDVPEAFERLRELGIRIGLISNGHRCLQSFQEHFELQGFVSATVTSLEHGYMKPHPSIFRLALERIGVGAEAAVMVGDSLPHDVRGAIAAGLRGVLLARGRTTSDHDAEVPVIRSLVELPALLQGALAGGRPA